MSFSSLFDEFGLDSPMNRVLLDAGLVEAISASWEAQHFGSAVRDVFIYLEDVLREVGNVDTATGLSGERLVPRVLSPESGNRWQFDFRANDGTEYSIEMVQPEDVPFALRASISRRLPEIASDRRRQRPTLKRTGAEYPKIRCAIQSPPPPSWQEHREYRGRLQKWCSPISGSRRITGRSPGARDRSRWPAGSAD